jgi:formylglycine-generating enzyme required for sulfatase activity
VSSLGLDKYLVSVGRFRAFVQAWDGGLGYAPPVGSGRHTHVRGGRGLENAGAPGTYEAGWDESFTSWLSPTDQELAKCGATSTWTPEPGSGEDLPITCVSWYEAYAFCIWDGGFLPSEAEWEYAAAGGAKQREYPWGSASPGTKSAYAVFDCQYSRGDAGSCQVAPVEVAAAGAALWGQLDMAGDIWEWTLDWFADYADPCVDCAQLTPALFRVLRGGSCDSAREDILPPARTGRYPSGRQTYGVRCARSP